MANISVTWSAGSGIDQQFLYLKKASDSNWINIALLDNTVNSYIVQGVEDDILYQFKIVVEGSCGTTETIEEVAALTCPQLSLTNTCSSISYSFPGHSNTDISYDVVLLNTQNVEIARQTKAHAATVTGTFSNLNQGLTYKVRIIPKLGTVTRTNCATSTAALSFVPTVLTQPQSYAVCNTSTAPITLTATFAAFSGTLTYQWYKDGVAITNGGDFSGATTTSLVIQNPGSNLGSYKLTASTSCGSVDTNLANITALGTTQLLTQPAIVPTCNLLNENINLNVYAVGDSLTYQWQKSTNGGSTWTDIPLATSNSYTILAGSANEGDKFRITIDGSCGPGIVSDPATVDQIDSPTITEQPVGSEVCAGGTPPPPPITSNGSWTARQGVSMPGTTVNGFYEYLPAGYNGSTDVPVIIFIHGLGEVGNGTSNLSSLINLALPMYIQNQGFPYNAIVIAPQFNTAFPGGFVIQNVINYVKNNYAVDTDRIYLTGLSMGGGSILDWGEVGTITDIAAMAILCPASVYQTTTVNRYKQYGMPMWFFHGDQDTGFTDYSNSVNWVAQLNAAPSIVPPANLTTLAGQGHPIWNTVYAYDYNIGNGQNVYQWLFAQTRGTSGSGSGGAITNTILSTAYTGVSIVSTNWQSYNGSVWSDIPGATGLLYSTATIGTYRYRVTNSCTTVYSNSASIGTSAPVEFTSVNSGATLCAGQNAIFENFVTGSIGSIQWEISTNGGSSWSLIPGATTNTYPVNNVTYSMNGYKYKMTVTGICGETISNISTLNVFAPLSVTGNPQNLTVCHNTSVNFTATGTCGNTVFYNWQVSTDGGNNWSYIQGATSSTYTVTATESMNGYKYRAWVSCCGVGQFTSAATLTVGNNYQIMSQPLNWTTCGTSVTLEVTVTPTTGVTYQWQKLESGVWTDIPGATATSYATGSLAVSTDYRVVVTTPCGVINSNTAPVTVRSTNPDWQNLDINTDWVCVGTDKYYKQQDMNICSPTVGSFQTGSLYQANSVDCGYTACPPPTLQAAVVSNSSLTQCLDGLIIETIYLHSISDLGLLPSDYNHPCQSSIGQHICNRAFYEIFANGIYLGDSLLNNAGGTGGATTQSGKQTCTDYLNTPAPLTGGTWTGNAQSRYSKIVITPLQALNIANIAAAGTILTFSMGDAMTIYNATCDGNTLPHTDVTWIRISRASGQVLFNACPNNNIAIIDVCSNVNV